MGYKQIVIIILALVFVSASCTQKASFPLHKLVKSGPLEKVREFLSDNEKASFYLNSLNEEGDTPLILAINRKNIDIVKLLVESGADVDISGKRTTPLRTAILTGDTEIVKYLILSGADLKLGQPFENQPIFTAYRSEDNDMLKAFIEARKDLLDQEIDMETLLGRAIKDNNYERVVFLIGSGADVNKYSGGDYPLEIAMEYGGKDIIVALLNAGSQLPPHRGIRSLVWNALYHGRFDLVDTLINERIIDFTMSWDWLAYLEGEHGKKDRSFFQLLNYSTQYPPLPENEKVLCQLWNDCDKAQRMNGAEMYSVFYLASTEILSVLPPFPYYQDLYAYKKSVMEHKKFFESKPDQWSVQNYLMSFLLSFIQEPKDSEKRLKTLRWILQTYEIDLNFRMIGGITGKYEHDLLFDRYQTPLLVACFSMNNELVKLLLEFGADPNYPSNRNKNSLDLRDPELPLNIVCNPEKNPLYGVTVGYPKVEQYQLPTLLLDSGAIGLIQVMNRFNKAVIDRDFPQIEKMLSEYPELKNPDIYFPFAGRNIPVCPVLLASQRKDKLMVSYLIGKGFPLYISYLQDIWSSSSEPARTSLIRKMLEDNNTEMTKYLLDDRFQAQFGHEDASLRSSDLLFALRDDRLPLLKILLDAGVDIDTPINYSLGIMGSRSWHTNPLLHALENNQFTTAAYLIKRGANPNGLLVYVEGDLDSLFFNTALDLAIKAENREIIAMLKSRNALTLSEVLDCPIENWALIESWPLITITPKKDEKDRNDLIDRETGKVIEMKEGDIVYLVEQLEERTYLLVDGKGHFWLINDGPWKWEYSTEKMNYSLDPVYFK